MTPLLKKYLAEKGSLVERALQKFLPKETTKPSLIHKAMRYSVFAGGKRLRPILVIAGAEVCGGQEKQVLPTACAIELIHTYSLIHDDLPAMDNDDLRRGRPTNHKVFGDDIAILAGDALLTLAFSLMAQNGLRKRVKARALVDVIYTLSKGAGTEGMIGGQVADIKADKGRWKNMNSQEFRTPQALLTFIHLHKTAALITASIKAGAQLVGGKKVHLQALSAYGQSIGLAFQIQDDILDRIGDKKKLGKKGSDQDNQKLTYPELYELEASKRKAKSLISSAHKALNVFGAKAAILHDLADYILQRDH